MNRMDSKTEIFFLPDWSRYNPYQLLLKEALARKGAKVMGSRWIKWKWLVSNRKRKFVIHVHWLTALCQMDGPSLRVSWNVCKLMMKILLIRILGFRLVWTVHNLQSHESKHPILERWLRIFTAHIAHGVIVHCNRAAELASSTYSIGKQAITVTPHGNYIGHYPVNESKEEARSLLGFKSQDFVFMSFGQIRKYKGLEQLISVFRELDLPNARLLIVGKPLNNEVESYIRKLSDGDSRIHMVLEFVPDDRTSLYHSASDVVVLPFHRILTSGAVILGLSMGLPVITTRFGCMPETVTENAGWIVGRDAPTLKDAMIQAYHASDLEARGRAAKAIAQNLDWDKIASRHMEVYGVNVAE